MGEFTSREKAVRYLLLGLGVPSLNYFNIDIYKEYENSVKTASEKLGKKEDFSLPTNLDKRWDKIYKEMKEGYFKKYTQDRIWYIDILGKFTFELSSIVSFNLFFNTPNTIKINITPVPTSDFNHTLSIGTFIGKFPKTTIFS